ncbi:T9SS type A sorting domain-containing protein [Taibaiella lutea]|nr:T9SS type A sorting domain-containing protein [Taibaiella lutea]
MCCLIISSLSYAQIAAKWTFETSQPTSAGPIDAEFGMGQASCFHASGSAAFGNPDGNGSAESYGSNNWVAGEYYQFHTSTSGMTNIVFAFDQTSSSSGPKSFFIQVSTDGTNYTSVAGSNYDVTADNWSQTASNYLSASHHYFFLPVLDNQADVYIRIALATGSTAANGGTIAGNGTSRVDNVSIGTSNVVLPLTLREFKVTQSSTGNLLQWKTAMEKDLNYFSVEKSPDGKTFKEIRNVTASNNIYGDNYQISDEETGQNACYRLRIFKRNGKNSLSSIVYAGSLISNNVSCPYNVLVNNQPLLLYIDNGKLIYSIVDKEGKILVRGENVNEGMRNILINFDAFSKGIYFLKTQLNGQQQTFKILKQ